MLQVDTSLHQNGHILVVDDSPSSLAILGRILSDEGYLVVQATSGAEALEKAENQIPELVLLDVNMPGMGGFDVCRVLKSREATRSVPVLFISATDDSLEKSRGFEVGAVDFISKNICKEEVLARVRTHLMLRRALSRLESMANYDHLTRLPNRNLFHERLSQALDHATRTNTFLALAYFDLDGFKLINDTLGHQMGDALLKDVANRVSRVLGPGDTLARLGGDEFAIILQGGQSTKDFNLSADRVLSAINKPFILSGSEVTVGCSIGLATFPVDGNDARNLLRNADVAMYQAKHDGKNCYRYFDSSMQQLNKQRLVIEAHLRQAMDRKELSIVYQPVLGGNARDLVGAEALLRWSSAEMGAVAPLQFIPVAEQTGVIVPIGYWVWETVCKALEKARYSGEALPRIGVNVSSVQFRHRDLLDTIRGILERTGVAPAQLEIELSENAIMKDPDHALALLRQLRDLGLSVAVDDFGTGYSSLAYLKRFPISKVKIDGSFVGDLDGNEENRGIVRAIMAMAHSLGIGVGAEGVETAGQLDFLLALGCDEIQGYHVAKPMPMDDLSDLLRGH